METRRLEDGWPSEPVLMGWTRKKTGHVRINITFRRVRVTITAVKK